MSVKIEKIDNTNYLVNGKEVREDWDGAILSRVELTPSEEKALKEYLMAQQNNKHNNTLGE